MAHSLGTCQGLTGEFKDVPFAVLIRHLPLRFRIGLQLGTVGYNKEGGLSPSFFSRNSVMDDAR
ncbi:MAG: hypothetical protein AAF590_09845 [Pseudomonadota bacterium]